MTPLSENKGDILIVDGDAASVQLLTSLLVTGGYEVRTASTSTTALSAAHTAEPDLILLDTKIPDMDGYEICQRLKADEQTRDIPIIFTSAIEDPKDKVKGFAVGGVDYITKPFQADEVLARVETHLTLRSAQRKLEVHNAQLRREIAERMQAEEGQRKALAEALQATHALRENEEKFRSVIEQANDGIVLMDSKGTIIEWNHGQEQITGIKRDQALGQTLWNILLQVRSQERSRTTEMSEQVQHSITEFLTTGQAPWMNQLQEWEIERTDGERQFVQALTFPIETAKGLLMGSVMRDITERKHVEKALKQANADLATRVDELAMLNLITQTVTSVLDLSVILNTTAEAMTDFFDAQGTVIALFQPSQTELTILAHHSPQSPSVPLDKVETKKGSLVGLTLPLASVPQVVKRKQPTIITQSQTSSALTQPVCEIMQTWGIQCMMSIPLQARGKVIGVIVVATDQVDREFTPAEVKLAETVAGQVAGAMENARLFEEQQKAQEQALKAKQAAEAANRAKSVFLANMSHELRTPLNAILGFAQLMIRDPEIKVERQENLKTIIQSGDHLLTLINDVLEMSKIEDGRATLHKHNFDLHRLLDTLKNMFALRAADKGLQLVFDQAPDVPQYVCTDESKLRQVLINLLSNAVKFTQDGCVTLQVGYEDTIPRLIFEVKDTGPGIVPEDMEKLFDPFVQTSGQEFHNGTGLGLPISQRLIRLMGGTLTVTSPPIEGEQGSVFRFDVPIELAEQADVPAPQITEQPKGRVIGLQPGQYAANGGPYRLLVVEDRKPNREVLVDLLMSLDPSASLGHSLEVREAANGQEAIQVWEEWTPHLIWMDIRMPVMDGHEATKRIKATSQGQNTIIIALTAGTLEEDRTTLLAEGCADFIRKPFRETEIFDKLAQHLGVHFVYEDEDDEQVVDDYQIYDTLPHAELVERLAILTPDWISTLQQATTLGSLDPILALIDQVRESDTALANTLAGLAHDFEHDKIIMAIQQAKEQNKATTN